MFNAPENNASSTLDQTSKLGQEIYAVLQQAGLEPTDNQRSQLLQALTTLISPNGIGPAQIQQEITGGMADLVPNLQLNWLRGSTVAPGSFVMSSAGVGKYYTTGYFADTPVGPNVNSWGILTCGYDGVSTYYQEWYDISSQSSVISYSPRKYIRYNVNELGWSGWSILESTNLFNRYFYNGEDTPLAIGQSVIYDTGTDAIGFLPLKIATSPEEVYELTIINRNPSLNQFTNNAYNNINLDLLLLPNNAFYVAAFTMAELITGSTFQALGANGQPALNANYQNWLSGITLDNTGRYGTGQPAQNTGNLVSYPPYVNYATVTNTVPWPNYTNFNFQNPMSGFWMDDIAGYSSPPYIRKVTVYTGSSQTVPALFCTGGGGSRMYNSGVNTVVGTWANYPSVGQYSSLGTILLSASQAFTTLGGNIATTQIASSFLIHLKRLM
jgi:hypothetical protein